MSADEIYQRLQGLKLFGMAALCDELGIEVRERLAFDDAGRPVTDDPNLNGSLAFYRLARRA